MKRLNDDPAIHGILVQMPLPKHLDAEVVIRSILPAKDVDGFHPVNVGKNLIGERDGFVPCTPAGVQEMLERSGTVTKGKECVIVGRSNIVGKPMMALMVQNAPNANATVTVCHSATRDLKEHTLRAEILIVAAGKANMVTGDMVREGAVVIDVGINRIEDASTKSGYRLVGDVEFDGRARACVEDHAGAGRRGAHDHRDAPQEHGARGRAERGDMKRGSRRPLPQKDVLEPQLFPVAEPPRAYGPRSIMAAAMSLAVPQIPGASPESAISVELLTQQAKDVDRGRLPDASGFAARSATSRSHRNGHWYFCLRGASAQVKCVMWSRDQRGVPTAPDDGMQVVALGQPTVYPAQGSLQCAIFAIDAVGDGLWRKALDEATARLRADGLLEPSRKRVLPRFPTPRRGDHEPRWRRASRHHRGHAPAMPDGRDRAHSGEGAG